MTSRPFLQPYLNNSLAIRQEIQRFESVHPSIYAIYDLIELIPDALVAQQIRDHVVCIEDSFVNSQEWTLSRGVPDLRLGIVGSLQSGKSALVHRYLTGSYMQEESPEGGRFKKEVLCDGHAYLLLIRDEGGPPEMQFSLWVDAVIFVFSLENEASFNAIYTYYTKMAHFRNSADVPLILVGTQDAISENNPRVIDDARARKLATDLKRCSYYETCATYGLNVERVFQDACQKIVAQRLTATPRPPTPGTTAPQAPPPTQRPPPPPHQPAQPSPTDNVGGAPGPPPAVASSPNHKEGGNVAPRQSLSLQRAPGQQDSNRQAPPEGSDNNNLPTPSSTPTTSRKSRRRSNLFAPSSKKCDEKLRNGGGCELGSGRAIPVKQGYLYKRSGKALNKDWKKKYVTLGDDGRLTYHPSLHDYMEDVHGKEISLQYVTVKVPGQKPRGSKSITAGITDGLGSLTITGFQGKDRRITDKVLLTAFDLRRDPGGRLIQSASNDDAVILANNSLSQSLLNGCDAKIETPNVKKRHRRMKSSGVRNNECDDSDGYEFFIVSLDNKQWHFEAANSDERDDWVAAIEQQILNTLQGNESGKAVSGGVDPGSLVAVRTGVPGNSHCVDCDAPNPDWASLNLGALLCIECSGVHRNLGSHISRVRSLDLDEWPPGPLAVMLALGNAAANAVWEAQVRPGRAKPTPESSREEKERWVRAKYQLKEFLAPLPAGPPLHQQLGDAVCRGDVRQVSLLLAHASPGDVNAAVGSRDLRTPLHLACATGNMAVAQLLIWHKADVRAVDSEGRTCVAYDAGGLLELLAGGT